LLDWSGGNQGFSDFIDRVKAYRLNIGAVESPCLDSIFSDRFKSP